MRGKTRAAVVASLSITALVAGCSSSGGGAASSSTGGSSAAAKEGGSITVHGCNPESDLVPADTTETCGGDVLDVSVARLVHYATADAKPENDIAESITTTDSQTFTIKLKKDYKFQDGTTVKAKNFVDAWNYAVANALKSSNFMEPIKGYDEVLAKTAKTMPGLVVKDDLTFTITTKAKTSDLPIRLGYTAFAPLPDVFFADPKAFGKKPIGAGPYQVMSWTPNASIVLKKFAGYSGTFGGHVDNLTFKIYQKVDAAYLDLLAGNLDVVDDIPASAILQGKYLKDLPDHAANRGDVGIVQGLWFSPTKVDPSLANPKLRSAISMSINRQLIVDKIFNGERKPLDGWVASAVISGYKVGACGESCTYNVDRAKQLLSEAGGYTGTLTITYNGDSSHQAWVDAVCGQITANLGIACQGTPTVDFSIFNKKADAREIKGLFRNGWQMDYPSPENFLAPIYKTDATHKGSNRGDYNNTAFDAKLAEAAAAPSVAEAYAKYAEAEALLATDMPSIPLWYGNAHAGWGKNVTNVHISAVGKPDYASIQVTG